jgi:adenylate/guanylate cyclase family protein
MEVDEEGTLAALKACRRELIDPKIAEHRGRIVKTTGDGALVEFASAVDAVRCAIEIQRALAERNATISEDRRVEFRIGINVGDIIIDGGDIYGDGVNVGARLEGLSEPGGICVSGRVHEDVASQMSAFDLVDAGARIAAPRRHCIESFSAVRSLTQRRTSAVLNLCQHWEAHMRESTGVAIASVVGVAALASPIVAGISGAGANNQQKVLEATVRMERLAKGLEHADKIAPETKLEIRRLIHNPWYDCNQVACRKTLEMRNHAVREHLQFVLVGDEAPSMLSARGLKVEGKY